MSSIVSTDPPAHETPVGPHHTHGRHHSPPVGPHHTHSRHRGASGRSRRRVVIGLLLAVAVGGAAAATGLLNGLLPNPHVAGDPNASGLSEGPAKSVAPLAVKVVRPKLDPTLEVAVEQIAFVEPYFQAQLKTRVSGIVRAVHKNIGDPVFRGEVLVEVDVPELDQEVSQKKGVVEQRRQELLVSLAEHENALAVVEVARAAVRQREAEAGQAEATHEFRRRRLNRLFQLAGRDAVTASVVDEEQKEYAAAVAAVEGAKLD